MSIVNRYEERKRQKKEQEKLKRREIHEKKIAESREALSKMTEEELAARKATKAAKVAERQSQRAERRARMQEALQTGQRILVDLEFSHLMTDTEMRSMAQQVAYCYGANTRARTPAHLIFSGLQGPMLECLHRQVTGLDSWQVTMTDRSYMDYFASNSSTDQLVYLSADSPHELHSLDRDKIYIVGGLVDRNRYKGVCYDKAVGQGIATARLPIGEYVRLASSQVMCTNHVVEILLRWLELKDWEAAFHAVIPTRKRKLEGEDGVPHEEVGQQSDDGPP